MYQFQNRTRIIKGFILPSTVWAAKSLWLGFAVSTVLQAIRELVDKITNGEFGEDFSPFEDISDVF